MSYRKNRTEVMTGTCYANWPQAQKLLDVGRPLAGHRLTVHFSSVGLSKENTRSY